MSIESMKAELEAVSGQITLLGQRRAELCEALAKAQAVFAIGDHVTQDRLGTHEIMRIGANRRGEPVYYGAKLKNDGTPSKRISEICSWYNNPLRLVPKEPQP